MGEMLEYNNLRLLFGIIIPPLIYAFIVWVNTPRGSVKLKVSFLYFLLGILATKFIENLHWIFPNWFYDSDSLNELTLILLCFFQIAFAEEFMKFIFFKISNSYRSKRYVEHPAATMFYMMSIGAGFAVAENIEYLSRVAGNPYSTISSMDILITRTFTALIVHMVLGLIMGYFIVRSKLVDKSENITEFSKLSPKIKIISWNILAVVVATLFHGFYDYTWEKIIIFDISEFKGMCIALFIVLIGLFIAFKLSRKIFKMPFDNSIEENK